MGESNAQKMAILKKALDELLSRRVESIVGEKELRAKLLTGKKLRIKHGVDPTTPDLHLGYSVVYHKLREFQDLGHTVAFLIGDFTARFGDPTDKSEARKMRDAKEVRALAQNYIKQVTKILDPKKTEIRYNSEWYDAMSAEELLQVMSNFTYAQLIERDMFQERIKHRQEIGLHEPVYPVLQGYDSVMLKDDVTVNGTDQVFNEMRGRDLQKKFGQDPQVIIGVPLLAGTDGKQKMSQSLGNYIGITEDAATQYGKIMSIPDDLIYNYFEMVTNVDVRELAEIKKLLKSKKANPRDLKMQLAKTIVTMYHNEAAAHKAEANFVNVFQKHETPDDIQMISLAKPLRLVDVIFDHKLAASKSEARRLVEQRGVKVNHHIVTDAEFLIEPKTGLIIQVGKRRFAQIK
ncbi:MAG: tyrosine--tRNA ligase [bacterium]